MHQNAVFYHIGGVMMEDEEKRRNWANDPPGWYFWSGVRAGARRLHGPYDSREQADEEVESFRSDEAYAHAMCVDAARQPQRNPIVQRIFGLFSAR
jgi:hypothetical protein